MDGIVDNEQLRELESLLYSQIHHSADAESDLPEMHSAVPSTPQQLVGKVRYFSNKSQVNSTDQQITSNVPNASSSNAERDLVVNQRESVQTVHIHQEIQFKVPQMQQCLNKIIFLPPVAPVGINNASRKRRRQLQKQRKKSRQKSILQAMHDAEVFKQLNQEDRSQVIRLQKKQNYIIRRREKQKLQKHQELIDRFNNIMYNKPIGNVDPNILGEIIELSDSDEDAKIVLDQGGDTGVVNLDDDTAQVKNEIAKSVYEEDDGSVEFVENVNAEPIIIDIDAEPEACSSKSDSELMKPPPDVETSSSAASCQSHDKNVPATSKQSMSKNRNHELLNTPESSNDFLDARLDVSEQNFNFTLHGSDLAVQCSSKQCNLVENCGSESSCSTSDKSSQRNQVFNEVDFESTGKSLFTEVDLELFSKFITPKRKSGEIPSPLTQNRINKSLQSEQATLKPTNVRNSSESSSSSESDYAEESAMIITNEKSKGKCLPSLSNFEVDHVLAKSTPVKKKIKTKKGNNERDMKDTLEKDIDQEHVNTIEKRSKKRKQKATSNDELADCSHQEISRQDATDVKISSAKKKRKAKSKSDSEINEPVIESAIKSRNKKSLLGEENVQTSSPSIPGLVNADIDLDHHPPSKRKKRKSRHNLSLDQNTAGLSKDIELQSDALHDALNSMNNSDVEIIEVPIETIDISDELSQDLCSTWQDDEQANFNKKVLVSLKTDLNLQNVQDPCEQNDSIVHDVPHDMPCISTLLENSSVEAQKSWLTPGFNVDRVIKSLPDNPKIWKILDRDRIHIPVKQLGPRCNKCKERGHLAFQCTRNLIRCWLCGNVGHEEPRCPNTICTNCGRATRFFTTNCGRCRYLFQLKCNICQSKGHSRSFCPDVWRRYHLTTAPGELVEARVKGAQQMLKTNKNRWCSGCGKSGHFEDTCNYYNRTHNRAPVGIYKYEDIYNMDKLPRTKQSSENVTSNPEAEQRAERRMEEELHKPDEEPQQQVDMHLDMKIATAQLFLMQGLQLAKELFDKLQVTHTFEIQDKKGILNMRGYRRDLLKVKHIILEFKKYPKLTVRLVKILNEEQWLKLQSNQGVLSHIKKQYNVLFRLKPHRRGVEIRGNAFNMLMAETYLLDSLATDNIALDVCIESDANCKESFYLTPKSIMNIKLHPYMKTLAKKHSVQWQLNESTLTLIGSKMNIELMKVAMGNFESTGVEPAYDMLQQITALINYSQAPHKTTEELEGLLKSNNSESIEMLNVLLLGTQTGQLHAMLQRLENQRKKLTECVFIDRSSAMECRELIHYFKKKRSDNFYMQLINKGKEAVSTTLAIDLYSLGESSEKNDTDCFIVKIKPTHTVHLLDTPGGNDFLNELNSSCLMELKRAESTLYLYCSENQKEDALKKLNFYFRILHLPFPKTTSDIYKMLLGLFARTNLDYYTINCMMLYQEIQCSKEWSRFAQLNGLLFAKYEFLDAREHVDALHHYMKTMNVKKAETSISDLRKIKTAVMHLFCPFALNVDYKLMVALAQAPHVPTILPAEYAGAVATVDCLIKLARDKFASPADALKMNELQVLEEYLNKRARSCSSISIALAFLRDNFPSISLAQE